MREINKSKIIINSIAVAIIILIITVLTIYMTNKKQAVEVSGNENAVAVASTQNKVTENEVVATSTQNKVTENEVAAATTQNTVTENKTEDWEIKTNNTTNNEVSSNEQKENNTVNNTNTTNDNSKKEDTKNNSSKGVIYLTFDDGPSSTSTPKVLDILKRQNVKASFFILNYSDANEKYVKREAEEGHTIGIHGYSHEYSKIYKSKEAFFNNVYKLQEKIYKTTGIKTMHMRFPGGSSNTVSRKYCKGIMTELAKDMVAKGFKYYDWNISSGDAGGAKNSSDVYRNVTKNLSKKRGNMVLMHDFGGNKKTLGALEDIIKYAKKNGYTFAPIDENTPMYTQHINN